MLTMVFLMGYWQFINKRASGVDRMDARSYQEKLRYNRNPNTVTVVRIALLDDGIEDDFEVSDTFELLGVARGMDGLLGASLTMIGTSPTEVCEWTRTDKAQMQMGRI